MCWNRKLAWLVVGIIFSVVSVSAEAEDWRDKLGAVMAEPTYVPSHWGILVADLHPGEPLLAVGLDDAGPTLEGVPVDHVPGGKPLPPVPAGRKGP